MREHIILSYAGKFVLSWATAFTVIAADANIGLIAEAEIALSDFGMTSCSENLCTM